MPMPWFKLFHEARTDLKLRALSRDQHYVWFNLLCYAAEQSDRGVIEFESDYLLALEVADGDLDLLSSTLERLQLLRIISIDAADATKCNAETVASRCIAFLAFERRQGRNVACNAKSSTERSRKHRQSKKLGRRATDATRCNEMQRDETDATAEEGDREGDREEELNTPPNPQGGNGVCVSTNGSEPTPIEDAPTQPRPQVDPAELTRVQAKAEALFPCRDFGYQVAAALHDWPLAWIDAALSDLAGSGKKDWHYLVGILKRYHRDGGPARASPSAAKPKRSFDDYDDLLKEMGCS